MSATGTLQPERVLAVDRPFCFGDVEIDVGRLEIRRGGVRVDVQPRVFDLIRHLVEHRDRVVSREELLDSVWGSRFVSASTLNGRIKTARQVLGDTGDEQQVIRTLHGRGYRFVATSSAPVDESGAREAGPGPLPPLRRAVHDWPMVGRHETLDQIEAALRGGCVGGVLIDGPAGVGTSRVLAAAAERAAAAGVPTLTVCGLDVGDELPLAAIAHLFDASVLVSSQTAPDLARADVMQKAISAIRSIAATHGRPLVTVDDSPLLDSMSIAVLGSLIEARTIFAVVARRRSASSSQPFEPLVGSGTLRVLRIEPLSALDVDVLLYRSLPGPIESASLQQLVEVSGGCPGRLRDIVRTAAEKGSLCFDDGVWRVVGSLPSHRPIDWPPVELSVDAQRAAEMLALVGEMPVGLAVELVGEPPIDELDARQLLSVDPTQPGPLIALADPALASLVAASIGGLRRRRLLQHLAERLLAEPVDDPSVLAAVLGWRGEIDVDVDLERLCVAARRALLDGQVARAGRLIDRLADWDEPRIAVLRAEAAAHRTQWELADRLLAATDVSVLEPPSRVAAVTLGADLDFFRHARHDGAISALSTHTTMLGEDAGPAITRRLALMAEHGACLDLTRALDDAPTADIAVSVDAQLALASSAVLSGRFGEALGVLDPLDRVAPELLTPRQLDVAATLRCMALRQLGRLAAAVDVARSLVTLTGGHRFGRLPIVAAALELDAARPRAARVLVGALADSSHGRRYPHLEPAVTGLMSVVELVCGNVETARQLLDVADARLERAPGSIRWSVAAALADEWSEADPAAEHPSGSARSAADEAVAAGAALHEAELLVSIAACDRSGRSAAAVLPRLEQVTASFDGELWPLQVERVRSFARAGGGVDESALADGFDELGFARLAARTRRRSAASSADVHTIGTWSP
jgi:DNA-binding winged helix-turn-helix (wHTH) protein